MSDINRRDLLIGGAAAAALTGCPRNKPMPDAAGPDAPAGCAMTDAGVIIMNNHTHAPHKLTVTSDDVAAGVEKTYDIQGLASHNHQVTITADQFALLKAGGTFTNTSTVTLCHSHDCVISCA